MLPRYSSVMLQRGGAYTHSRNEHRGDVMNLIPPQTLPQIPTVSLQSVKIVLATLPHSYRYR